MKKRALSILLCAAMAASGMVVQTVSAETAEEITEIIWYWPSQGTECSGLQDVENALNAMMEPDIGVHVTLEPVSYAELANRLTLDVSSGTQVDLALTTSLNTVVDNNLILPLTDIFEEYGQAIFEDCGAAIASEYYNGEIYGAGPAYITTNAFGYLARKDVLDKYGIEADPNKVYTLDELEEVFKVVKEGEGENFFCVAYGVTSDDPLKGSAFALDKVGSNLGSGCILLDRDFKGTTLVNLFETEEYAAYADRMYEWAQAGYISKDLLTNTESTVNLVKGGNYLGEFYWCTPSSPEGRTGKIGTEMVPFVLQAGYRSSDNANGTHFVVPVTSANPEKAVQALNYIYEHDEAAWLLMYGIEGVDYEITEETEDGKLLKYLSDDVNTLSYYQPYGVYGDRLSWPAQAPRPINTNKMLREFDAAIEEADERVSAVFGYRFISTDVATEFANVNAVIAQYAPSINTGSADPAELLPEFIDALKDAGIDKVIEENQKQLDAWLEINK